MYIPRASRTHEVRPSRASAAHPVYSGGHKASQFCNCAAHTHSHSPITTAIGAQHSFTHLGCGHSHVLALRPAAEPSAASSG